MTPFKETQSPFSLKRPQQLEAGGRGGWQGYNDITMARLQAPAIRQQWMGLLLMNNERWGVAGGGAETEHIRALKYLRTSAAPLPQA